MAIIFGTANNDTRTGANGVVDTIDGLAGNDVLSGGTGADTLIGGLGNDTFTVDSGLDVVIELNGEGIDLVKSSVSLGALFANVENVSLTGSAALDVTGNNLSNSIFGNSGANILNGGGLGETDFMSGGGGNDTYVVDNTGDTLVDTGGVELVRSSVSWTLANGFENLTGEGGSDIALIGNAVANTITGNNGGNFLSGMGGNDVLIGGTGNDNLDGGIGADNMNGGDGDDNYTVDNAGDVVSESGTGTADTVYSSVTFSLNSNANLENLHLTGGANINGDGNGNNNFIEGNTGNNVLNGNGGNDTIDGGSAGNDLLQGGTGTDYYIVSHGGVTVTEIFGDSNADTVETSVNFTLGANVENLLSGNSANDYIQLYGNELNNIIDNSQGSAYGVLRGLAGNDILIGNANQGNDMDGGTGADTMTGGFAADYYTVDDAGDVVNEALNGGYDYVYSSISYTMADNVEELYLQGSSNINGIGNALSNYIEGNSNVNLLLGGDGNDNLNGMGGADIMIGGTGDDAYNVDNAGDSVVENAGEGTSDTVYSSVSYTLGAELENLFLNFGSGAINATGNAVNNYIYGNGNDNIIDGAGSASGDYMQGEGGNDVYHVRNVADSVFEYGGDGTDTVQTYVDLGAAYLFANVENLVLNGTVVFGTGNDLVNTITGNAENNTIDGKGGADIMIGAAGNDFYVVDNTSDLIIDSSGTGDQLYSSASFNMGLSAGGVENGQLYNGWGNINLTGNSLNNILTGNTENNTLDGGAGADVMTGNGGTDTYVVDNSGDTVFGNGGTDVIRSSINWDLAGPTITNVDNLTLTGNTAVYATGNANSNTLIGNSIANVIDGRAGGADYMAGGDGDDDYYIRNLGDVAVENANQGNDEIYAYVSHTMGDNIETMTMMAAGLTGTGNGGNNYMQSYLNTFATTLFGLGGNDTMYGSTGNDTLDGGTGADSLNGAGGNDVFVVDNAADYVYNGPSVTGSVINSTVSWDLGAANSINVNNLTFTADFVGGNTTLTGNGGTNTLTSNSDFNSGTVTLNGGAGADTMIDAGAFNNSTTFIVDNAGDTVTASGFTTTSIVRSSVDFNLGMHADLDNLFLTGSTAQSATGNAGVNIIDTTGNTYAYNYLDGGNDTLADTLIGSSGTDIYTVRSANDVVTETGVDGSTDQIIVDYTLGGFAYTLAANIEQGYIASGPDVAGTLTGNGLDNYLSNNNSFSGSTLNGGIGADYMVGAGGDDTFVVDNAGDQTWGNGGNDTVLSSISFSLASFGTTENLTLLPGTAVTATGNGLVNILTGNALNNTLDGGAGDDTMIGGLGSDLYIVDSTADVVTEAAGQGTDTVQSSATFTLSADVDHLVLTGGSNINGTGNLLANSLTGNSGNNTLDGGSGADVMIGGLGSDYYVVDQSGDSITETGADIDTVQLNNFTSGFIYTLGASIENGIIAAGPDVSGLGLTGNSLANTLTNNNTSSGTVSLDGGLGADILIGSGNKDVFVVDNAGDSVTGNGGGDDIRSGLSWDLTVNTSGVNSLLLTGTGNFNAFGTAGVDTLTGNSGNNTLDGRVGTDTMAGGLGNDTYFVDNGLGEVFADTGGTDTVISSSGGLDISGRADLENATITDGLNNNLTGNGNVNILIGDASDNQMDGVGGADTMNGGDGNDAYFVENTGDVVIDSSGSSDLVYTSVNYTLGTGIESGTINGNNVTLTGSSDNNTLGNAGFSGATMDGGAGADTLNGSGFDETFVVDNTGDQVFGISGIDTIRSSITWDLNVNSGGAVHLVLTGSANINGTGNGSNNSITGNSGNNSLDGGSGTDAMSGLGGNDTYIVDNTGDTVTESTGGGNDNVFSSVDFTLGANVENLTLTGTAIYGHGNASNNNLTGNGVNNVLDGHGGADAMTGGAGDDVYYIDDASDQVFENSGEGDDIIASTVSHVMEANVERLTMFGTGNINATGNTLNNIIIGNDGDNTLDGGAGTDTLTGGLGNDTYVADSPGDVLNENDFEGTDTVIAGFSATLQDYFENLTLSGALNLNGTGNSVGNTIIGNSGNNSLDGAAGSDVMQGGAGDDTYFVDNVGDVVTEAFNQGNNDTVHTLVSHTLGANVENLVVDALAASGLVLGGNALVNYFDATLSTSGVYIDGQGGVDVMNGSTFDDTFVVDNSGESITGNGGMDQILSSATWNLQTSTPDIHILTLLGATLINGTGTNLADTITGNTAKNILTGLDGDDILNGGGGADTLVGGQGNDTYTVNNTGVLVTEAAGEGTGDTVYSSVNFTLGANVERLFLSANGTATGNTGSNYLEFTGGAGTVGTLDGGTGIDTMVNSNLFNTVTFIVDNAGDVVDGAGMSTDTVLSSVSYTITDIDVDNLTLTGTAANGTGNASNNNITGNASANVLDDGGTGGSDVMTGLGGNDTYIVNNSGDQIVETSTGGTGDVIQTFVNFDMTANAAFVENLLISSGADLTINGNALNNTITGNVGWDNISGQAGNDRLLGNDGNDQLFGGIGNDILLGGLDNDILDGGVGKDTLTGGAGQDTFHFSGAVTSTNADIITAGDFTNGPGGDILDVSDILVGYNGNITEFVQISNSGANTLVKVDVNGLAGGSVWTLVATINGVNLGNDELALQGSGNLVVT